MWLRGNPKPKKLTEFQKAEILNEVDKFIKKSEKLSKKINRTQIRIGRVYLYHLVKQFGWDDPESKFIKPLIDGKYSEFHYARITIYDNECSLDWQRHNNKWVTITIGSMQECLQSIDETGGWFE